MNQQTWDKQINELGGSILQSWVWGQFQEAVGQKINRFSGDGWAALVVEHDLIMNKKYWYAPRGPVGNAPAAAEFLHKEVQKDHSIIFIRQEPQEPPLGFIEAPNTSQPKENWVVGLEGSEQELMLSMKPKHRYNINLAAKKGVTVRPAVKQDFLVVWKLLLETARRGNFKLHPQNYYLQMWEILGPEHLQILIAEYQGEALACAMVSLFGHTATYLHGGSSDKNKQLMAPYLLHWEAMKLAKSQGYFNYDFGGISNDPAHAWAGITRFKHGFGGFEVRYPGTFDMVLSPLWYNIYKNGRKLRRLLK